MNFSLSDDLRMIADVLGNFLRDRYDFYARGRIATSAAGFDRQIWGMFAELGIIGLLVPEKDGGFGGGGFDISLVFEATGRALVVEPLLGTLMASRFIGDRIALMQAVIAGTAVLAVGLYEPDSRYDFDKVETRAERVADGWRLTGAKATVANVENANYVVVTAQTTAGTSAFLVPTDAAGIAIQAYSMIDGGRGGELLLDRVLLPHDALLGAEGGGLPQVEAAVAAGIVALSAEAVGIMEAIRETTIDYLQTRRQFGRPIGTFQALQHRMATLLIEIEQARSATINAAAALDEEYFPRERAVSAAKFTIGRVGTLVAEEAIQMHGGIGMTWELPLSHLAKRLVMIGHQLGDEDHHLERYIALGRADMREDA